MKNSAEGRVNPYCPLYSWKFVLDHLWFRIPSWSW
uniref:Uncharacterized protein n=1 Tax=Arundo donax TaxID=35708 RepID=A0A0A8ZXC0_ARUDO